MASEWRHRAAKPSAAAPPPTAPGPAAGGAGRKPLNPYVAPFVPTGLGEVPFADAGLPPQGALNTRGPEAVPLPAGDATPPCVPQQPPPGNSFRLTPPLPMEDENLPIPPATFSSVHPSPSVCAPAQFPAFDPAGFLDRCHAGARGAKAGGGAQYIRPGQDPKGLRGPWAKKRGADDGAGGVSPPPSPTARRNGKRVPPTPPAGSPASTKAGRGRKGRAKAAAAAAAAGPGVVSWARDGDVVSWARDGDVDMVTIPMSQPLDDIEPLPSQQSQPQCMSQEPPRSQSLSQYMSQDLSQCSAASWATCPSQDPTRPPHAELVPNPSYCGDVPGGAKYPGSEAAGQMHVSLGDRALFLADAAGKMERVARRLGDKGRRGRRVAELRNEVLTVQKVQAKREYHLRPGCEDEERLAVCFWTENELSKGAKAQLAHGFRECVGPLRRGLRVDVIDKNGPASKRRRRAKDTAAAGPGGDGQVTASQG